MRRYKSIVVTHFLLIFHFLQQMMAENTREYKCARKRRGTEDVIIQFNCTQFKNNLSFQLNPLIIINPIVSNPKRRFHSPRIMKANREK